VKTCNWKPSSSDVNIAVKNKRMAFCVTLFRVC
jgi:hypothetical protein